MRLPILSYAFARGAHAPGARGLFEVGLMRDQAASAFLGTMGDPPNVSGALWATRMSNVMGLMAQGRVDLGFIGGAEVDRFGNLVGRHLHGEHYLRAGLALRLDFDRCHWQPTLPVQPQRSHGRLALGS